METTNGNALMLKLQELGVDKKYHVLLSDLTTGDIEYLHDITENDLVGRMDSNGTNITISTALALLKQFGGKGCAPGDNANSAATTSEAMLKAPSCAVTLTRTGGADGVEKTLLRCALRGSLQKEDAGHRQKVLAVVLDRSGSMAGAMWRRVVEAVAGVLTDELLSDQNVRIAFIVYSDDAREVKLPRTASALRELLLSPELAPKGGTNFRAAFTSTRHALERELRRLTSRHSLAPKDVDLATLVFTDGEDTSIKGDAGRYGVRLVDKEASSAAARAAGDEFRRALQATGCPTYVCMAAFGADHDPDQCQYLSDRYYYINRGEALTEVLAGGLGALLASAGQCSVRFHLPKGVSLEEPLPETLPLDAEGCLDHHVWLRVASWAKGSVAVHVEVAGVELLHGKASVTCLDEAAAGSFEHHLFLVDLVALQLRAVARELCGRQPLPEELTGLRSRLTDAKERLLPTKEAVNVATGQLRGRAALRERLAEVEALRERLSYALGQYDERDTNDDRKIGTVAVDAILRDAGQHVPQGSAAAALARRTCALAELPRPEPLSEYGREYTTDAYSCCDAEELANQADALFFPLANVRPAQSGFVSVDSCSGFVSHEAFMLLSKNGRQPVKHQDGAGGFTHLGLPLYATAGHFRRAELLLPDVLQRLSLSGAYQPGVSERQLVSLLGRSLASAPTKSEDEVLALLHKARAVFAVLRKTPCPESEASGGEARTLLDSVVVEAERFLEEPSSRPEAEDLYAVAGAGLLSAGWDAARLTRLGAAVAEECLRRKVAHGLRGALQAQRLFFAWALLGEPAQDDDWLHRQPSHGGEAEELCWHSRSFDPFTAPAELEELERQAPGSFSPRPAGVAMLLNFLSGKQTENTPALQDWGTIRGALPRWAQVVEASGGLEELWGSLDRLMTKGGEHQREAVHTAAGMLRMSGESRSLGAAFGGASNAAAVAFNACLPGATEAESCLRHAVAKGLREVVEKRAELARAYPITGADFPNLGSHSALKVKEVWGAPANPVDPALHHKAMLRVCRRMMKVRVSQTVKEALADKEYRKRGGQFAFPSPMDTFVRGLHRRTRDLHEDWRGRLSKATGGEEARGEAVEEMLLRLRWDDSNETARAKLAKIVGRIWDGLEGVDLSTKPLVSSALWLNDEEFEADVAARMPVKDAVSLPRDTHAITSGNETGSTEPSDAANSQESAAEVAHPHAPPRAAVAESEPEVAVEVTGASRSADEPEVAVPMVVWPPPGLRTSVEDRGHGMPAGRGRGRGGGGRGRAKARPRSVPQPRGQVMDAGLREAFASLPECVVRRMEMHSTDAVRGSRLKLPTRLTAIQRKAVHLWAEERGLEHRSFGFGRRRRMHLTVPGMPAAVAASGAQLAVEDSPRQAEEYEMWPEEEHSEW